MPTPDLYYKKVAEVERLEARVDALMGLLAESEAELAEAKRIIEAAIDGAVLKRVRTLEALLRECHLHIGNRYPDDATMQRRIDLILNQK